MDASTRIAEFWNWLPAFRVVAETQHLGAAAARLHVSPSALSRTIRLLESAVGESLFQRVGRGLQLSSAGEELLAAARDAMRLVDQGVDRAKGSTFVGPVHFAVAGPFTFTVPPALVRLAEEHPRLVPHLHAHEPRAIERQILAGTLDAAFVPDRETHPALSVEITGTLTIGVYCGRGHPLHRARRIDLSRVLEHEFAAPIPAESGLIADGWPPGLSRRVTLFVQNLHVALSVCAAGRWLAIFPDRVVSSHALAPALRRLPLEVVPAASIYAVRRRRLGARDRADVIIDLLRDLWST